MNSDIEKLLVLQDRDRVLHEIESSLAAFPAKRSAIEEKIRAERLALKESEDRLKKAELERSALRSERRGKEAKAESMNEQRQSLMKKPAEYQALEHFIESLKKEAEQMEEAEIGLLYEIDALRAEFEKAADECGKAVKVLEGELARLDAEKGETEGRLDEARFKAREAESGVSADFLRAYEILKKRATRRPFLAKVEDGKCSGCHLKLSGDNLEIAKKGAEPVNCEMCGRLIYFE